MYKKLIEPIVKHPTSFFVVISSFFGLLFLLLIPPFQIPDELIHFTRSYEISQLKAPEVRENGKLDRIGSELPKSILKTYNLTKTRLSPGLPDVEQAKKYNLGYTKDALDIPLNTSEKVFFDTGSSPSYFPLLYLPQAITIKVLELFNTPIIVMLYAVRVAGLAIWIGLAAFAIRILKNSRRKVALASALSLPMFVAQGSASTDPLINGLAVLFCVLVINILIVKEVPSFKKLVLLGGIITLMIMSKPVYIIFGLLFILIFKNIRRSKDNLKLAVAGSIPLIVFIGWSVLAKISGGPFYSDSVVVSNANPTLQIDYITPNIFNFIQPFMNTLFLGWGDYIYVSLIGMFGKLDTPLPLGFVILGYIFLIVVIFARPSEEKLTVIDKLLAKKKTIFTILVAMLIYVVGVLLAMYVYSTPSQAKIITGVQGRYFLPLIPLAVIFASRNSLVLSRKVYNLIILYTPVILLIVSALVIYLRFYTTYP